ncbi:hypothetical protein [Streptomyces sp. SYP-A7185]|uniref:hypothetical protein n=1 Tax=Streptomyces sp. SYP-A7185 TaxID=3040076 RepID=UPI0038F7EE2F
MTDWTPDRTGMRRALESLADPADRRRFLRDFDHFRMVREHHELAAERGVRLAPLYRRAVSEQLAHEADRRRSNADVTWRVWDAAATAAARAEAPDDSG